MIDTTTMTPLEVWKSGLDVLSRELGAEGMIRFLQLFERGSGDYTLDRDNWLPSSNVQALVAQMKLKEMSN